MLQETRNVLLGALVGALAGGLLTFLGGWWTDLLRRKRDTADAQELARLRARCVLDEMERTLSVAEHTRNRKVYCTQSGDLVERPNVSTLATCAWDASVEMLSDHLLPREALTPMFKFYDIVTSFNDALRHACSLPGDGRVIDSRFLLLAKDLDGKVARLTELHAEAHQKIPIGAS